MTEKDLLIQELRRENELLKKELNTAIKEVPHYCKTCLHIDRSTGLCNNNWQCGWQWMGLRGDEK